jgi:O6-methylguanine-DNA--protein-cysteine methyltransferase
MTQAIPRIDNDLDFEPVKQRITEMIDEIEQETDSSLNEDEKLEVASEMMGSFTADELADGANVSLDRTQEKITYWLAIGTVEAGTTTEHGHVAYRVVPEST